MLSVPVLDEKGRTDHYITHLTRDITYMQRNPIWQKQAAQLEGAWCDADAPQDADLLYRLSDYINHTDLSAYHRVPPQGLLNEIPGTNVVEVISQTAHVSMWDGHMQAHAPLIEALRQHDQDEAYGILNRMYESPLMHGITQGATELEYMRRYPAIPGMKLKRIWDVLLGVCEYIGIIPPQNHEQGASYLTIPIKDLVAELAHLPNFRAPPWKGGQWGLKTDHGLFGDRDLMALYIALKVREKFPGRDVRVLEIGGGAGYVAYWLYLFGYRNITMVDLPTVMCCQAFQLHTNLPDATISLPNETQQAEISFLDAQQFIDSNGEYDLIINCDSLPEMSLESVHAYLNAISRRSRFFYSINQESRAQGPLGRQHSVRYEIKINFTDRLVRTDRGRFWLRDGYTEEWYMVTR
jgi:hypothetical protein